MLLLDGVGLHVVESELKQCIQRHLDWLDDIVLTVDESTWLRWSKQRRSNAAKCQIRQQFNNSGVAGGNKNQKQLNCKAEYKHERAPLNRDFYEQGAPPNRGVGQKRRLEMNRAKLVAQNVLRAVKRRRPTGPSPGARRPSALVASPGARCPANSAVNNVQILHNPNRRLNQTVTTAMSRTPSHIRVVANHHDDRKLDIVTDRAVPSVNNTEHHAPSSSVNCTNNGGITIKQEEGNSCHDDSVECQQQTDGAASESSSGDNDCDTAPPSENKPIPPITYFNAVKLEPDDTDYYTINDDVITDNDQQQYGFTIPAGSSGVGSGGAGSGEENGPIPGTSAQITGGVGFIAMATKSSIMSPLRRERRNHSSSWQQQQNRDGDDVTKRALGGAVFDKPRVDWSSCRPLDGAVVDGRSSGRALDGAAFDGQSSGRFPCPTCDKTFKHKSNLYRHVSVHSGRNVHTCPVCAKIYFRSDLFKSHLINHHSSKTTPPLPPRRR